MLGICFTVFFKLLKKYLIIVPGFLLLGFCVLVGTQGLGLNFKGYSGGGGGRYGLINILLNKGDNYDYPSSKGREGGREEGIIRIQMFRAENSYRYFGSGVH